jgi:glycosyltransferase involved in cell wall biosynthesis
MKITFVVPELNLSGGLRVVSIYARLLAKNGHDVTVVSPNRRTPTLKQKLKKLLRWNDNFRDNFNASFFENATYKVKVLDSFRPVMEDDVPDSEVIIATFWTTAEWIEDFSESKGKKSYFVQHYEIHPGMPVERVKATLHLPFKKIVVAKWLADILIKEYKQGDISVIPNAVEHDLFYAEERSKNKKPVFGMMYSNRTYKGSQFALDGFKQLQKQFPSIQLVAFGTDDIKDLPKGVEYYLKPEQNKIREIYSQCDAWLFSSTSEGFGLPIIEAMACRTPVIGTRCGAAPDLLSSGGGILIDCNDQDGLLAAMTKICKLNSKDWLAMSDVAHEEALRHSWEGNAIQFEQALTCND